MLTIPSLFVDLPLREYDESLGALFVRVWVNPALGLVRERGDLARETINIIKSDQADAERMQALEDLRPRRQALLVNLIGHGESSDTRWTPDLAELDATYETSPDFVRWLTERVMSALDGRLEREKKA